MAQVHKSEMGDKISGLLRAGGFGHKYVEVYGSQIVVTCKSEDSARKVANVLKRSSFIFRGITRSRDENVVQKGTRLVESHEVWRAFFCV